MSRQRHVAVAPPPGPCARRGLAVAVQELRVSWMLLRVGASPHGYPACVLRTDCSLQPSGLCLVSPGRTFAPQWQGSCLGLLTPPTTMPGSVLTHTRFTLNPCRHSSTLMGLPSPSGRRSEKAQAACLLPSGSALSPHPVIRQGVGLGHSYSDWKNMIPLQQYRSLAVWCWPSAFSTTCLPFHVCKGGLAFPSPMKSGDALAHA